MQFTAHLPTARVKETTSQPWSLVPFQVGCHVGGRGGHLQRFAPLRSVPPQLAGGGAAPHQVSSRLSVDAGRTQNKTLAPPSVQGTA